MAWFMFSRKPPSSPLPPLHLAAKQGDVGAMEKILKELINTREEEYKRTALHVAADVGEVDSAKTLLEHGASIDLRDSFGWTPLHIAAQRKNSSMMKLLIQSKANINLLDAENYSPLHYATKVCDYEAMRMLLAAGASTHLGDIPVIFISVTNNDVEALRLLLAAGANPNAVQTILGRSSFHQAILLHHEELVREMVKCGADINLSTCDTARSSPLHIAASLGDVQMVQMLIDLGSRIHARDTRGATPLACAVTNGHLATIRRLLDLGADPHIPIVYPERLSLVEYAAERLQLEAMLLLWHHGCSLKNLQRPVLHSIQRLGVDAVARVLATGDVVIDDLDSEGRTALYIAASAGRMQICALLVDFNADCLIVPCNSRRDPSMLLFGSNFGRLTTEQWELAEKMMEPAKRTMKLL